MKSSVIAGLIVSEYVRVAVSPFASVALSVNVLVPVVVGVPSISMYVWFSGGLGRPVGSGTKTDRPAGSAPAATSQRTGPTALEKLIVLAVMP